MAVLSYIWHDPLLLSLVILNVVPLIILYIVKQFRASESSTRRLPKVHVFTSKEATAWKVLDRTKPHSWHPVIFISNHAPLAAQNPDQLASANVVSNQQAEASANEKIVSSADSGVSRRVGGLEHATSGRASMAAAGRKAILDGLSGSSQTPDPTPF